MGLNIYEYIGFWFVEYASGRLELTRAAAVSPAWAGERFSDGSQMMTLYNMQAN
jgi:hypothetical protein